MRRSIIILSVAFCILQAHLPQAAAATSATTQAAVYALIKYSDPTVTQANVVIGSLTPAQIASLQKTLVALAGKKFIIINAQVIIITSTSAISITNTNNIISMKVGIQSAVMADLTGLNTQNVCNINDPWYDYLYCSLDNLAKKSPGSAIGDDAMLQSSIKSTLTKNYFAGTGGFEGNLEYDGSGNTIEIYPLPTNAIPYPDKLISFFFVNDPFVYDKNVILGYLNSYKSELFNESTDFFYVVSNNVLEPMSVYDINKIIAAQAALKLPSLAQSLNTACYDWQAGSVIPCNQQIDLVDANIGLPGPLSVFNDLQRLGYWFNPINRKDFQPTDGLGFLQAVVQSQGQIFFHKFHQSKKFSRLGGLFGPMACVAKADMPTDATHDGNFIKKLNDSGLFNKVLTQEDVFFSHWSLACFPKYCLYIRPTDTKIDLKALQSGYLCYGASSPMNAKAHYLNVANKMSGPNSVADMKLLTRYLLGLGPDKKFYSQYPPLLNAQYNLDVSNLLDYGGPGCTNCPSCLPTAFDGYYNKAAQGTLGPVQVQIPAQTTPLPGDAVHLFPYVTSLTLINGLDTLRWGPDSQINFSDDMAGAPTLDFKVKGKNAIKAGPTRNPETDNIFTFKLVPEVEVVPEDEYTAWHKKGKGTSILKSMFSARGATAKANGIAMVGNPLANLTVVSASGFKVDYFPYDKYFWNYNARADVKSDFRAFKENVPYKVHPWVSNILVNGRGVRFDFSSDVASASPCSVLTVDASQCTNFKAIYAKDQSPKFINKDNQFGNDALGFVLEDATLYQPGDTLVGPDGNVVPPAQWNYSLKVTIKGGAAGVRSYWNSFPLEGNNGRPSYWYLDRDNNTKIDVFEGNSDTFPQTEGNFNVYIACAPPLSACCIPHTPKVEGDFSTCEDTTAKDCASRGGAFHKGYNCFSYPVEGGSVSYNYYGTPGPDGQVIGMCPAHCPQQPRSFKYVYTQTSKNPDPSCAGYTSTHREIAGYNFIGSGMGCPGAFEAGNTGFGFGKHGNYDACGALDTYQHANADDRALFTGGPNMNVTCPSSSGSVGCDGGSVTHVNSLECSTCGTTTKVTVSEPQCGGYTYAAQDNKGNIKCCKLNEWLDKSLGVCKPIYTSQYCAPSPAPSPSPSSSPSPT